MSEVHYGKILVVEDDLTIQQTLKVWLTRSGFTTMFAERGDHALALVRRENPDLVILDVMLPQMDGLEFCKKVRNFSSTPVLMLSALSESTDKILGLEVGADDYLAKPFDPKEVVARVRALLRRTRPNGHSNDDKKANVNYGMLRIVPEAYSAQWDEKSLKLTKTEFNLLHILASNPGSTISREKFLDKLWSEDKAGDHRTVDSHIRNIRKKFRKCGCHNGLIESVWGIGYRVPRLEVHA